MCFFGSVSISVPSSSFYSTTTFCLSLPSYESFSTSSLFIPPFILPKTKSLVDLPIFCTLGVIRKEWEKRKNAKAEMGERVHIYSQWAN